MVFTISFSIGIKGMPGGYFWQSITIDPKTMNMI